jgi:formylglycine-generating enzyme
MVAGALLAVALACRAAPPKPQSSAETKDMVLIQGGTFSMGTNDGLPFEGPVHPVTVRSFWMDRHEVTVADFTRFVDATKYRTEAENYGWSGVFDRGSGNWTRVDGASWRHPDGPKSTPAPDEPVTQVSWNDAVAFAKWAGKRLPTEAEFEYAARGGLSGRRYAWGDELRPGGHPVANWWQGSFPRQDRGEDGFSGRAPVGRFPPNGYGLYDITGNVWEWCADWFGDYVPRNRVDKGPPPAQERVIRGGSWMCSENYCQGFRVAARSHATPDSGLDNLGFRLVRDAGE